MAPITADAPPAGYPGPTGAQPVERFGQAMHALGNRGDNLRAGHKRFDDGAEIADVWVSSAGMSIPMLESGSVFLFGIMGQQSEPIGVHPAFAGKSLVIPASTLRKFDLVRLDLPGGKRVTLRRLPAAEQAEVGRYLAQVDQSPNLSAMSPGDRAIARALVFENNGLPLNRDAELLAR
jgi:hypothetical protein